MTRALPFIPDDERAVDAELQRLAREGRHPLDLARTAHEDEDRRRDRLADYSPNPIPKAA